jgi:hypothetical protein
MSSSTNQEAKRPAIESPPERFHRCFWLTPGKRIIKGRPFEVGLIVRINAYNKERPHE